MRNHLGQKGQIFILSLIVLTMIILGTVALFANSLTFKQNTRYNLDRLEAVNLAEAGIDKAVANFNSTGGTYNGDPETVLGPGSFEVVVTTINPVTKLITSTGFVPNKSNPKLKKTVSIEVSRGDGISFNYGVQVGEGGLQMSNNARVNGSVYSNGNISMDNGSRITGDAYVGSGIAPVANQEFNCTDPNCTDFVFGQSSGNPLDTAQSFTPSSTQVINKVSLRIKKTSTPSDITVRILGDSSNKPNKNNVLTSGTLFSNLVTSSYSWVDVTFNSSPSLTSGTRYWIVLDSSANSNNYWSWQLDTLQGYTQGEAKWSPNWQATNPVWNTSTGDLAFKVYMGGVATKIQGQNNSTIGGNAYANTLINLGVTGKAYYQLAQNLTAGQYFPGSTDPVPQSMPISEGNIQDWRDAAVAPPNQTYAGDVSGCPQYIGPGKYIGNINFTNQCNVIVRLPIWIVGDLNLDNGAIVRLDTDYGLSSAAITVDGKIKLSNNGQLRGSGAAGSFLMGLSTFDSTLNGVVAIESDNGSNSSILYANKGIIQLRNNASLTEITAWKILLDNGAQVTYNSGLASAFFSSGPSGSYSVVKGTYRSQ